MGLRTVEFARLIGTDRATLYKWETGMRVPVCPPASWIVRWLVGLPESQLDFVKKKIQDFLDFDDRLGAQRWLEEVSRRSHACACSSPHPPGTSVRPPIHSKEAADRKV